MHDGDRQIGKAESGVLRRELGIVPPCDSAVEHLRDGGRIHVDVFAGIGDALQIEHDGERRDVHRHVERACAGAYRCRLLDLFGIQWLVRGGPYGRPGEECGHAGT